MTPSWSRPPLDKLEEPLSLVALKGAPAARFSRVYLPELLLEMHAGVEDADGLAMPVRAAHKPEALPRATAPSCQPKRARRDSNLLNGRDYPALRRVAAELDAAELHPDRNLDSLQRHPGGIPLARAWGGGDVAIC
jgi:hypothetical protein